MKSKSIGKLTALFLVVVMASTVALGGAPAITVTEFNPVTGAYALSLASCQESTYIFAASADDDKGSVVDGWSETRVLGQVPAGEESVAFSGVLPRVMINSPQKVRFFAVQASGLPGTRVQYLTSSAGSGSAGSYIDTLIVPDVDTAIKITAKYSVNMAPFGVADCFYQFCYSTTAMSWGFMGKNGTGNLTAPGVWDDAFHTFELSKTAVKLDGTIYGQGPFATKIESANAPIALFGRHSNETQPTLDKIGVCSISSATISKGATMVGDFVPYWKDGKGFMYDRVTKAAFENKNVGYPFTAGPELDPDLQDAQEFSVSEVCETTGDVGSAQITDIAVSQDAATRRVNVSYVLTAAAPVIVTARLLTNGVAVVGARLDGDVGTKVVSGSRSFYWWPDIDLPNIGDLSIQAELKVWTMNNPPPYLVFDIRRRPAPAYESGGGPRHYSSAEDLPGGLMSERYWTTHLVMRRVNASGVTFRMGSPVNESHHATGNETRYVTFTKDFYMGVFEFTQGQFEACSTNKTTSAFCLKTDRQNLGRPVEYTKLSVFQAFLDELTAVTGTSFGLPTEAQWEFACRAGTSTMFHWGAEANVNITRSNANPPGNSLSTWTLDKAPTTTVAEGGTGRVGMYGNANAWGFYDMSGNVWEACADGWVAGPFTQNTPRTAYVDPVSAAPSTSCVRRGGGWASSQGTEGMSASRESWNGAENLGIGFRVICPAP